MHLRSALLHFYDIISEKMPNVKHYFHFFQNNASYFFSYDDSFQQGDIGGIDFIIVIDIGTL